MEQHFSVGVALFPLVFDHEQDLFLEAYPDLVFALSYSWSTWMQVSDLQLVDRQVEMN